MIRKNKKFIDPRYFMEEKMELNEDLDKLTGYPTTSPQGGTGADTSRPAANVATGAVLSKLEDDLNELYADHVPDMLPGYGPELIRLAGESNDTQDYIQKIKEYLNSAKVQAVIKWEGLGDEVLLGPTQ